MTQIHPIPISEIVGRNKRAGGHFFDRSTLRFFRDTAGNWSAHWINGRVFIRNVRHNRGPGMFSSCTLRGQCREVYADGSISLALPEFEGMRPRQIARAIENARPRELAAAARAFLKFSEQFNGAQTWAEVSAPNACPELARLHFAIAAVESTITGACNNDS